MQITKNWLLEHGICVDKFNVYHNGKKIKNHTEPDGYVKYSFHHNSTQYNILAHVLMYTWYVKDIPEGFQIHHKDGDKENNNIKNLEMLTSKDHVKEHRCKNVGNNMNFKVAMAHKKQYTLDYINLKIEEAKNNYDNIFNSEVADKKALHAAGSKYWRWVNIKKQFIGEL